MCSVRCQSMNFNGHAWTSIQCYVFMQFHSFAYTLRVNIVGFHFINVFYWCSLIHVCISRNDVFYVDVWFWMDIGEHIEMCYFLSNSVVLIDADVFSLIFTVCYWISLVCIDLQANMLPGPLVLEAQPPGLAQGMSKNLEKQKKTKKIKEWLNKP